MVLKFRHMIRLYWTIALFTILASSLFSIAINADSLETELSYVEGDSALSARAELAYARGLYHASKDLLERIKSPMQADLLLLGLNCHILAKPYAARGYLAQIVAPEYLPLAMLGLAELYCGDIADPDSCARYIEIVEQMDYLGRFVELRMPDGSEPSEMDTATTITGPWTLQFGAFAMRSLAEKMAVKVHQEGIVAIIVPQERDDGTLYFVYGGSFLTKAEAAAQADALAKEFVCKVVQMPEN